MTELLVTVHAFGPLLFRDARPFSASADEARARSLELPPPTTIAGLLRTTLGRVAGFDWSRPADVQRALGIRVPRYGFAVARTDEEPSVVLPAPASVVIVTRKGQLAVENLAPSPSGAGAGTILPGGLRPLLSDGPEKPERGFTWWAAESVQAWLADALPGLPDTVSPPVAEQRVQIGTMPGTLQAADGMLFTVDYRLWESATGAGDRVRWVVQAQVDLPSGVVVPEAGSVPGVFGGEQRPVVMEWRPASLRTQTTPALLAALTTSTKIKLYLRTPALFVGGWRPGWVDHPEDLHPELAGARLVGAAVGRPETVSGWSYDRSTFGPKATRWAAPAGSTYFFELPRALSAAAAGALSTTSVCDSGFDEGIGYGQALWGVWKS